MCVLHVHRLMMMIILYHLHHKLFVGLNQAIIFILCSIDIKSQTRCLWMYKHIERMSNTYNTITNLKIHLDDDNDAYCILVIIWRQPDSLSIYIYFKKRQIKMELISSCIVSWPWLYKKMRLVSYQEWLPYCLIFS